MKEIPTIEFLAYYSGFIAGKEKFLLSVLNDETETEIIKDDESDKDKSLDWYRTGYVDAVQFYHNTLDSNEDICNIVTKSAAKKLYVKRVTEYNNGDNSKKVPIGVFKVKKL